MSQRITVRTTVDLPGPHFRAVRQGGLIYVAVPEILFHIEMTARAFDEAHASEDISRSFRAFAEEIRDYALGTS